MTIEEAITFSEYAQIMAEDKPGLRAFYRLAESALRAQQKLESNQPLTMDDLRHMNGEIVFCEKLGVYARFKGVVRVANHYRNGVFIVGVPIYFSNTDDYGNTWIAYRHKLKED